MHLSVNTAKTRNVALTLFCADRDYNSSDRSVTLKFGKQRYFDTFIPHGTASDLRVRSRGREHADCRLRDHTSSSVNRPDLPGVSAIAGYVYADILYAYMYAYAYTPFSFSRLGSLVPFSFRQLPGTQRTKISWFNCFLLYCT